MAPNSEESMRISHVPFTEEIISKEKQRPPIYNPEDYVISLKKWGKKASNLNAVQLYPIPSCTDSENGSQNGTYRDYRNPMLISAGSEMTLRQFGTVSELLAKLKSDLRLAYPSFVQEFVADPLDGVNLLLDLLRAIQLSQSQNHNSSAGNTTTLKIPPSLQRRALLDELSCLQCLFLCCQRYTESIQKLTSSSAGLFTLAICIMSNVTKSRVLALELLTRACMPNINGHTSVSEALSTLRLRFGEPVRFRFLIGMLMSAGGQGELLVAGMRFLNIFLDTADNMQKRLYIEAELEQAGFDIAVIKKNISINSIFTEQIFEELDHWEKRHVDVESLFLRLESSERDNDMLKDKLLLLERRVQILLEEKGILISLEQCLKERCSELQEEVHSLKSERSHLSSSCGSSKKKESPHEDEGISSSERSLTPDDQRESSVYELYNVKNEMIKKTTYDDDEETTIEEVIEELRNIINDAETEVYQDDQKKEAQIVSKIQMTVAVDSYSIGNELEIVPSNLHPQPPRRTKSLVHLFIPDDYDYSNKELFFENETAFSSEESADSLLSTSKNDESTFKRNYSRHNIKRTESFRQKTVLVTQQNNNKISIRNEDQKAKKSKSLDRIDDCLESIVDIVVTDQVSEQVKTKSDSGVSHVFSYNEERMKIFLPSRENDTSYYFPRVQEKKTNSFLIKRGHTNAGMYSGNVPRDQTKCKNRDLLTRRSSIAEKVTDFPSGLY